MAIKKSITPQRVIEISKKIAAEIRAAYLDIKAIQSVRGAFKVAPVVVERVERIGQQVGLFGTDKKAIAVEAILAIIPDSWVPDWLLRPVIGWAIEKAVKVLNAKLEKR